MRRDNGWFAGVPGPDGDGVMFDNILFAYGPNISPFYPFIEPDG